MLQLIGRLLGWLRGGTLNLLAIGLVILLVWGIASPVGTLVWWLGEGAESLGLRKNKPKNLLKPSNKTTSVPQKADDKNKTCYIIFLPGVGDFSADELTPGETYFLNRLLQLHPNCVAVSDVFPYSAANTSLGGGRPLAKFWQFANDATGWLGGAEVFIKIRNLWRFAISADARYGPVYNQGIANAIIERMNAQNSLPKNPKKPIKIVLIGTSGGVQVSLGAATYLKKWINPEIFVVSIGGVFDGNHGFEAANNVYHLKGKRDLIEDIGGIIFASRWSWVVGSPFNQARLRNQYTEKISGPHAHDGEEGYFGENVAKSPNITYVQITVKEVEKLPFWQP